MDIAEQVRPEAWAWWEARRLRYNLGLAVAGLAAYSAFWLVMLAFGQTQGLDMRALVATTAFLGLGYMIVMAAANGCYLLGIGLEILLKPQDRGAFRARFWALGFWGSCALPFVLPVAAAALGLSLGPGD